MSVKNYPAVTFYPKTKVAIKNIVTWAKSVGKKVRVSAYKHSWGNLFSNDNEVLVSLLSKKEAEQTLTPILPLNTTEFQFIQLEGEPFEENGKIKHLCKIGSATSNEQLRQWSVKNFLAFGNSKSWTIPLNVILVENTLGGTNSMICHGAGIQHPNVIRFNY